MSKPSYTPQEIERARDSLERALSQGLSAAASSDVPARIIQILPLAQDIAEANTQRTQANIARAKPEIERLLSAVYNERLSAKAKVAKLRDAARLFNEAIAPFSACSQQTCAHCCHIPVALNQVEAELIGDEIGKKPRKVKFKKELSQEFGYHLPCPFLKGGRCSIYASRPFACRLHLNLDESDRLCVLEPGVTVPVPLANATQFQSLYVEAVQGAPLADIRDFFG